MLLHRLAFLCFLFVFSMNNPTELVSTYSKVARWGASTNSSNEPRSSGQSLWTHRSDVNIRRGQNLKTIQPVTYYYSMKVPSTKVDEANVETVPSKGEVQERFNPRPYFDFTFDDPPRPNKEANAPISSNSKPPSVIYGSPFDGISPLSSSKPPTNTYDSPFTSYNPPNIKPDDSKKNVPDSFNYPPNNNQQSQAEYEPPKNNQPISSSYRVPTDSSKLPLSYAAPQPDFYDDLSDNSNNNNNNNKPTPSKDNDKPSNFHPPLAPPLNQPSDSYLPASNYNPQLSNGNDNQQSTNYQMPNNNEDDNDSNNNTGQDKPPEEDNTPYSDSAPSNHNHHSMAESDLSPPPPQALYGKFPQYLDQEPNDHDFYHFGHHDIYHEVRHKPSTTTTTTTEAPRAGHYSYYYLGRKLWYIPLYFSVYFIVYVTILILKSISRHKIQFSHHFDKGRSSRALQIASVNQTVIDAIENVQKHYM